MIVHSEERKEDMAACVVEEIAERLEVEERLKKERQKDAVRAEEHQDTGAAVMPASAAPATSWDANQLLLAGIVLAIVILSCTALVYAARH
jgi:hypothetical protein